MAQTLWQKRGGRGWIIMLCLVLIALFQYAVPIFSDEAYFVTWGLTPAAGYYDHPPLTGWISTGLIWLDDQLGLWRHGLLHRGFGLLLGAVSFVLLYRRLERMRPGPDNAGTRYYLMMAGVLTIGSVLLFNMYLNDTLVAAASLGFLLTSHDLWRARAVRLSSVLIAALALSAMLLTKFSSAILYLALVFAFLWHRDGRRFLVTRLGPVTAIAAIPFLWNLWWNFNNCAVNYAFNFGFRDETPLGGPVGSVLLAVVLTTGVMSFLFLGRLWRDRAVLASGFFTPVFLATLALAVMIGLARGGFGANWAAAFGFLAVLALAEMPAQPRLRVLSWANAILIGVTLIPLLVLLGLVKMGALAPGAVMSRNDAASVALVEDLSQPKMIATLRDLAQGRVIASTDYGTTAQLKAARLGPVLTLSRQVFGRNDDLFTDLRDVDGHDFLLVSNTSELSEALAASFFDSFSRLDVQGTYGTHTVFLAQGFRFSDYFQEWLGPFIRDYYDATPFPYRACPLSRYGQIRLEQTQ
ncbi:MAG TPA: hypothetical protein ENK28_03670 [Aliiroseovarius sp.]|nr:hypothetical protein [Aliiroseovarius sp.]